MESAVRKTAFVCLSWKAKKPLAAGARLRHYHIYHYLKGSENETRYYYNYFNPQRLGFLGRALRSGNNHR